MSFYSELKRRNVFRVGAAYVVIAWLLIEVSATLEQTLHLPEWSDSLLAFFLILGFPPALFFSWAFEITPEGIRREEELVDIDSTRLQAARKLDRAIIVSMTVALSYFALDKFVFDFHGELPSQPSAAPEAMPRQVSESELGPELPLGVSIAVLPFVNMSSDPEQEYFSDGISEELLNSLARVKEFKVIGRTSSFAFKGENKDLRLIGDTLGVTHILEGSVRKSGERVRITAQLIQTSDGFHQWSNTYDRELTDIFAVQDEISRAILGELKTTLISGEPAIHTSASIKAFENYLLAKLHIYMQTNAAMLDAVLLLEEAIEIDPGFAPAWAQLGIATHHREWDTNVRSRKEWWELSGHYIEKSLELDPGLDEGWAALGLHEGLPPLGNRSLAIEHLEKALAINPSMINASNWLQRNLLVEGRVNEALNILKEAFRRDPLYPSLAPNLVGTYMPMGLWDEARAVLERIQPLRGDQRDFQYAEASLLLNTGAQALAFKKIEPVLLETTLYDRRLQGHSLGFFMFFLAEFDRLVQLGEENQRWHIYALARLGRTDEANRMARETVISSSARTIELLSANGQHAELMNLITSRWGNAEEFASDCCGFNFGFGQPLLIMAATAYRETGDMETFERLMALVRANHDRQIEQGANWYVFWYVEAWYWTLAGDFQRALDLLQRAADAHLIVTFTPKPFLGFDELASEPRFKAIRAQMLQNLNHQRQLASLENLEVGY